MEDFIGRFGEIGADGKPFLSSSRQSIITSLLSAGYVTAHSYDVSFVIHFLATLAHS